MRRWTFAAMSLGLCIGLTTVTQAQEATAIPPAPVSENSLRGEALQISQAPAAGATAPYEGTAAPVSPMPPAPPASKPAAPKPPPQPWKPVFFDNDFSYKKTPHTHLFGEDLKDIPLDEVLPWDITEDTKISVGGEVRHRYMDERNRLRPEVALRSVVIRRGARLGPLIRNERQRRENGPPQGREVSAPSAGTSL